MCSSREFGPVAARTVLPEHSLMASLCCRQEEVTVALHSLALAPGPGSSGSSPILRDRLPGWKGSVSCPNSLQMKHSRSLLIPNTLFLKCARRLHVSYKEKCFFARESVCGPESTVADMVGESHPVPGVWWTPASPCPWGAETLQAVRKVPSCPAGTEAPGITCKANLNLPPGRPAQGSILAGSVCAVKSGHQPHHIPPRCSLSINLAQG